MADEIIGFSIDKFRANFSGGAKSYLFSYLPTFPDGTSPTQATYLVNSTSLPARTIAEVAVPWQGFDYKIAGKSEYGTWDIVFKVDKEATIKQKFDAWQTKIHDPDSNERSEPGGYMEDQYITLLSETGTKICTYHLFNAWPSVVSDVPLDYSSTDIAVFTVTFIYQYHTVE